jgi:hypothetical protein
MTDYFLCYNFSAFWKFIAKTLYLELLLLPFYLPCLLSIPSTFSSYSQFYPLSLSLKYRNWMSPNSCGCKKTSMTNISHVNTTSFQRFHTGSPLL